MQWPCKICRINTNWLDVQCPCWSLYFTRTKYPSSMPTRDLKECWLKQLAWKVLDPLFCDGLSAQNPWSTSAEATFTTSGKPIAFVCPALVCTDFCLTNIINHIFIFWMISQWIMRRSGKASQPIETMTWCKAKWSIRALDLLAPNCWSSNKTHSYGHILRHFGYYWSILHLT